MGWKSCKILVTGGASFIGSHLCDALVEGGASEIRVVDDLSSGVLSNLQTHIDSGAIEFLRGDLLQQSVAEDAVSGMDLVFHLAAIHGGRGYVDLHQAACSQNLMLDGTLIKAAHEAGVQQFVFASSGCVYPNGIQTDTSQELYLREDMVGPPYDADNMYGWAKLMTEMTLRHYHQDFGLKSASCRFFTVYGERGVENHAVIAMIARAFHFHFTHDGPIQIARDDKAITCSQFDVSCHIARSLNNGRPEQVNGSILQRFDGADENLYFV